MWVLSVCTCRCACVRASVCRLPLNESRRWPCLLKIELRYPGEAVATHHRYRSSCDVEEEEESGHLALSAPPAWLIVQQYADETFYCRRLTRIYISDVVTVRWVRGLLPCHAVVLSYVITKRKMFGFNCCTFLKLCALWASFHKHYDLHFDVFLWTKVWKLTAFFYV